MSFVASLRLGNIAASARFPTASPACPPIDVNTCPSEKDLACQLEGKYHEERPASVEFARFYDKIMLKKGEYEVDVKEICERGNFCNKHKGPEIYKGKYTISNIVCAPGTSDLKFMVNFKTAEGFLRFRKSNFVFFASTKVVGNAYSTITLQKDGSPSTHIVNRV